MIDQGRGIPADKLEIIFGRFQQVDASDSRQKGGSGLGLAICRAIVLQHNGRIWAERNPMRGSTFRVFLPYRPAAATKPKRGSLEMPGEGVVLLASDNEASRPLIGAQLADHGYHIVETATMEQTLAAAHDGVEAIVLDIGSNGLNAWEILPRLRRTSPEAHTPVVLLNLDTQIDSAMSPMNGRGRPANEGAQIGEMVRILVGPEEKSRILVIESDVDRALTIGEVYSQGDAIVKMAHSREKAEEDYVNFQPHLLVLNIGLPGNEALTLVDWLREQGSLPRIPLVVYSGRNLSSPSRGKVSLLPPSLLTMGRVQPEQLELLLLTMLRGSRQIEEDQPDVSSVR